MNKKAFLKDFTDGWLSAIGILIATSPIWIFFVCFAAWVTHVVTCIKAGALLLLIIGAVLAPIGVIHGIMVWLGIPWTI